ncbi:MAG: homocysteine S-methyltransferase family protein [Chloroflexota bacterium]|nr:homocysteine S-methyltransferase family protein [Chloroflexota bacterium]MDE2970458.1 homocysteine S-methyltransferase family protein [Chloroflexota bacterium]
MATLMERLATGRVMVSDGATWTYLQQNGLESWQCAEEFNVTNGPVVQGMAAAYLDAGAEMVLTNTFGGNRYSLGKYGFGDRVAEFNREAAQHARSQAGAGRYVVGSVGPLGEFPLPLGRVHPDEMRDAYAEQVVALAEGGVDAVLFETLRVVQEAEIAIAAAKEHTDLPIMASMVFDRGDDGFITIMGLSPAEAMERLQQAGADVVGANCGNGVEDMVAVAREIRSASSAYTIIHSNAGIPSIRDADIVYPESPEYMAPHFAELARMGVSIVGGCCGTGPEHIRALTAALR